jgi:hypothetical protein
MDGEEFVLSLETLPLLSDPGNQPEPSFAEIDRPSVLIFPHLSEQGSHGEISRRPESRIHEVPHTFERIFEGVSVRTVGPLQDHELEYQDSSLADFLHVAWDHLLPCNILVTHRNFLANEVLARASRQVAGNIPNAAVVRLKVRRIGDPEKKTIFFVRHCTSHNNATRRGSGSLTTCADVSSLKRVAA